VFKLLPWDEIPVSSANWMTIGLWLDSFEKAEERKKQAWLVDQIWKEEQKYVDQKSLPESISLITTTTCTLTRTFLFLFLETDVTTFEAMQFQTTSFVLTKLLAFVRNPQIAHEMIQHVFDHLDKIYRYCALLSPFCPSFSHTNAHVHSHPYMKRGLPEKLLTLAGDLLRGRTLKRGNRIQRPQIPN
jgi:hypothetical protein